MNVNKVIQVGRLTNAPELKTTQNGREVATFSIANNYSFKDKDGNKQEKSNFHNVVAWGKQAEIVSKYLTKGQEIYLEGRMETRSWDDQDSGKKMYRTEIVMEKFEFGSRPGGSQNVVSGDGQAEVVMGENGIEEINPDDIPF